MTNDSRGGPRPGAGRPLKLTTDQIEELLSDYQRGKNMRQLARKFKISQATARRTIARNGVSRFGWTA